ncbi:MAG: EAL domain-containing protein [Bacillota bacterium]
MKDLVTGLMVDNEVNYKSQLEAVVNMFPLAFCVVKDAVIVECNDALAKVFGYEEKTEVVGLRLFDLSPLRQPDGKLSSEKGVEIIKNVKSNKEITFKWVHQRKNRGNFLAKVKIVNDGFNLCAIIEDISAVVLLKQELILFKKILENNSEGVVITDINGSIKWVNAAFEKITGYALAEAKGKNMSILNSGIQKKSFYYNMWQRLKNKGHWSGEICNKNKKGEFYSEWLIINSIKDSTGATRYYAGIFRDLSEKKKIDLRMIELQQKDVLTGLHNRSYFLECVDNYIRNCKAKEQFSVVFIDIENFKTISNSLGYHIGDRLLVELSKRLLFLIAEIAGDCILSRYSGNEFAILCKAVTAENVKEMAARLIENIKKPFVLDNTVVNIAVNIGISKFPDDGGDASTLIRHAETAIYKPKGQLEERISFYSAEVSHEIEERFRLINFLTTAITNEELEVYYQPIFDIKNFKNIVGLEALLRWKNPTLGNVSPDKFIPLAEKTGYIIHIGEWILKQVCKQIKSWNKEGLNILPIAVNISVRQLEQVDFSKKVMEIVEEYGIGPKNIELEITESVSSGELMTIVKNLRELKKYGLKISMDDFGTGFSSLGQIELFELDKLKIDKIFVDGLLSFTKKQNLVKSIIAMGKSLNLTIVAEGIETKEQLLCLEKFGCQLGQGYILSKPLPAHEIEHFISCQELEVTKAD